MYVCCFISTFITPHTTRACTGTGMSLSDVNHQKKKYNLLLLLIAMIFGKNNKHNVEVVVIKIRLVIEI